MTGYRWVVLAAGIAAQAANSATIFAFPVLAPEIRRAYGLTLEEVGLMLALAGGSGVVTLLAWGVLTDRIGERAVIGIGLGASAAALAACAARPPFAFLTLLVAGAGMAGASVAAASGRAVMGWFDARERGLALGIRQTAVPLGGAVAAVAVPPLLAAAGLAWTFAALAALCVATALVGVVVVREPPLDEEPVGDVARPLRDRRVWRLSIGSTFYVCVQIAFLSFLVLYLHDERGLSVSAAGAALAVVHAGGAVLRIVLGRLSDRLGARVAPLRLVGVVLAAAVAAAALLMSTPNWALVPALVVAGALSMSWNGLSFTAAAELAGRERSGASIGFQQTVLSLTAAVVPPMFAVLVEALSWNAAYGVAAFAPLAGWALLRPLRRH